MASPKTLALRSRADLDKQIAALDTQLQQLTAQANFVAGKIAMAKELRDGPPSAPTPEPAT